MPITRAELIGFLREERFAVEASVSRSGSPQAALLGIVVSDRLEVFFDTLASTRKIANLRSDPRVAFVIGGWTPGDERTVQYEGVADEPQGPELDRLRTLYFARFPDGRERLRSWPGLAYVRAKPTWIRYSDFNQDPPIIQEFDREALQLLG